MTQSSRNRPPLDRTANGALPIVAALSSTALVAATVMVAYALGIEPFRLELTHPVVPLPDLPAALDGLSILLIADTHVSSWGRREKTMISLLENVQTPDIIVWAGDFIQGKVGIPHVLRLCEAVAARFPTVPAFGILGNAEHKMRLEFRLQFVEQLERRGLRILLNAWEPMTIRGEEIAICGVDDPYYGHADLAQAMRGMPESGRFALLLAHSPQIATQAARAGFDLMLSGHTHGGQVRLPIIGPLKTQNPLARTLDCGLFDENRLRRVLGRDPGGDLVTYISRGVGVANVPRVSWLAPRLLCRPEIARLVLRRASHGGESWGGRNRLNYEDVANP